MRQRTARRGWLTVVPLLTGALMLVPVMAGLIGTALPAFGYLPAIGGDRFGFDSWRVLVATPGFAASVRITLQTGFAATVLSLALAIGFCAWVHHVRGWQRLSGLMAPVLAAPHSALAIGVAFLIAPSGWIVRALSPWLTGFAIPPEIASVGDANGIALVVALVLKETPFLILMIQSALQQVAVPQARVFSRSLGYTHADGWLKTLLPQVYPHIRLPIYAVLAFSLSVVDIALIVGPENPPTLSVLSLRGFRDPDVRHWFPAAAAALLLFVLVAAAVALWRLAERAAAVLGVWWIERGRRGRASSAVAAVVAAGAMTALAASALSIADLGIWSVAAEWHFPDALPRALTLANWTMQLPEVRASGVATLAIAVAATTIALVLVLGCLENESRRGMRAPHDVQWLIYLPLLVPQIAFLFGVQVVFVRAGIDGTWAAVVAMHAVFVLPYLFLALADPWHALDPRYARSATALGASPGRVFLRIKLPFLLRPILIAAAVAFAVSAGQYLPTLFAGAGRIATLTTDAVALASGADRRVVSVYAVLQAVLPLLAYVVAIAVPAWMDANRRGLELEAA